MADEDRDDDAGGRRFPAPTPRRSRRSSQPAEKPKQRRHVRKRDEFEVELMRMMKLRRMLNR